MCAVVVFEVEKAIELFWSVAVECEKVVKTEKSAVTPRYTADSNSAHRVQLTDMSEVWSTNRGLGGVPFYESGSGVNRRTALNPIFQFSQRESTR